MLADVIRGSTKGWGDRHVALHYRLTPQPRIELEVGSLLDAIELIVFHRRKIFNARFHNDVTRGAGTASPAGVLQMKPEIHRDVQQRFRLAVIFIRQLAGFKFKGFVGGKKSYFGQNTIVSNA